MLVTLAIFGRGKRTAPASEHLLSLAAAPASASALALRAVIVPLPSASAPRASSARELHGDGARQHRSSGVGPKQPKLAWKTAVGGAVAAQVTTNAAASTLYVTTLAGELLALGVDGAIRWRKPLGGRVYSAASVAKDGTVYVGSDEGHFVAFRENGDEAWKFDAKEEVDTAALLRADGTIVFNAGKSLYGLRANGTVLFRTTLHRKIFAAVAELASGQLVVASQDHRIRAFSNLGEERWSLDLGADIDGAPVVGDGGEIYVGTDGAEVVSVMEGRIRWRTGVGGFVRGPLSLGRNGDVLVGTYGPRPRMLRLAAVDGHVLGEFGIQGTGAKEFGIHGGPLEDAAGSLFFGAQDDHVYAIGPSGIAWKFATGADVDAPLTLLADGTLLVGSYDGFVYALRDAF